MLEEGSDAEMKELAKEELAEAKESTAALEEEIKILLIPKDPNDDKNVFIEIRGGAGGDEAAVFAGFVPDVHSLCRAASLENRSGQFK